MKQKSGPGKAPAEQVLKDIRRQTRRQYSAEEKIRIVLEGLRGDTTVPVLAKGKTIPDDAGFTSAMTVPLEVRIRRRRCSITRATARASIPGHIWPATPESCRPMPMADTTSSISPGAILDPDRLLGTRPARAAGGLDYSGGQRLSQVGFSLYMRRILLPMQPGDVPSTFADVSLIASGVGYRPQVPVHEGVARFV